MKYFKKVEGKRIYLSPVSQEDAEIYTKWMTDPVICRNTNSNQRIVTLTSEREFLAHANDILAIVKKDNEELLGNISFSKVDYRNRNAEVGLFIGEEHHRHLGYGTEALNLMLEYGFQQLNFHSILLNVLSFNENAIRCYEKLGFQVVGTIKEVVYDHGVYYDRIIMQILESDWRK